MQTINDVLDGIDFLERDILEINIDSIYPIQNLVDKSTLYVHWHLVFFCLFPSDKGVSVYELQVVFVVIYESLK